MSKLRIFHLPIHSSGVAYYRHHLPLLALRAAGHTVTSPQNATTNWMEACLQDGGKFEEWLDEALGKGVDVIHMGWSNNLQHVELGVAARMKYKSPLIIDYDDDVLSVESYNLNYMSYHEGAFSRKVARLGMRVADMVTCSTAPLTTALHLDSRAIAHLPNYTHPPHWLDLPTDPRRGEDKSVRLMLAGGPSHLGDYKVVRSALEWAISHYDGKEGRPHLKVIFVTCMPDWAAPYINNSSIPTANRVFYAQGTGDDTRLWQLLIKWVAPDIMLAPLLHNKFNESKSLIKAYDAAMVEGCAFLCEQYPTYEEVPKEAAIKVDSTTEGAWHSALTQAVENVDLRRQLSQKLREWVLDHRTISAYINKWEHAYEDVLSRPIVSSLSDVVRPRIYGPDGQLARDTD